MLTARLAHLRARRPRGSTAGRRGGPWASGPSYQASGQASDHAAEAYAHLDQQLETIREACTCPKCSSEHYKDQPA